MPRRVRKVFVLRRLAFDEPKATTPRMDAVIRVGPVLAAPGATDGEALADARAVDDAVVLTLRKRSPSK